MNTRSRKALSPVVASIILIAVTVAVSIAVAAWMGALTFTFTATEQVSITNLSFQVGTAITGNINITASNTGTTPVTINEVWVNNAKQTNNVSPTLAYTIQPNSQNMTIVTIKVDPGYSYQVKLVSSKGNAFISTGTAPS